MNDLLNKNYKAYLSYAMKLTKSKEDAEDLVQDAYIKLHNHLLKFVDRDINESFLYVIIKNLFLDNKRKKSLQIDEFTDVYNIDIYDESKNTELRYNVDETLKELTYIEGELLIQSRSIRQMSKDTGVTVRVIKTIKDNAKDKFKKKWEQKENPKDWEM